MKKYFENKWKKTGSKPKKQWNFIKKLIKGATKTRTDISTIE